MRYEKLRRTHVENIFLLIFVTFIGIGKFCVTLVTAEWFSGHFSLLTAPTPS